MAPADLGDDPVAFVLRIGGAMMAVFEVVIAMRFTLVGTAR